MKYKLHISYDGTSYSGWQVQPNAPTVQESLQDAVEKAFGKRYSVTGCSRTDSGVHAKSFCCSIDLGSDTTTIPSDKIPIVINRFLPDDISVLDATDICDSFHPRYDVVYKEYEYIIWNSPIRNVFLLNKAFTYPKKLDERIMSEGAKLFVGKYDFSAFMSSGSSIEDAVREIKYFTVRREGDKIIINVAADGFLYNMVRILVGTLIEVSDGKILLCDIPRIIHEKNRKKAGFTAPPQGLYLSKVVY